MSPIASSSSPHRRLVRALGSIGALNHDELLLAYRNIACAHELVNWIARLVRTDTPLLGGARGVFMALTPDGVLSPYLQVKLGMSKL